MLPRKSPNQQGRRHRQPRSSANRRFPPPWSVEGSIKERVRLAPGCRYEFQILSAASPTAVFKDIVFDELARTECRQT
jgi:hypothetical protein